jgi:hypothetical protein
MAAGLSRKVFRSTDLHTHIPFFQQLGADSISVVSEESPIAHPISTNGKFAFTTPRTRQTRHHEVLTNVGEDKLVLELAAFQ